MKHSSTKMQEVTLLLLLRQMKSNMSDYIQLSISGTPRDIFPVLIVSLITQQFNVMFKCRIVNTFHCTQFQVDGTNDIHTNYSDMILMWNLCNSLFLELILCVESLFLEKLRHLIILFCHFYLFQNGHIELQTTKGWHFIKNKKILLFCIKYWI